MDEHPSPRSIERTQILIDLAKQGDHEAREEVFERYLPVVRHIVAARMGIALRAFVDSEDVVQSALLRAVKGLDRFGHQSEGSFRNWLAACVENEIRSSARSAGAEKRGGGNVKRFGDLATGSLRSWLIDDQADSPSQAARVNELEERIERALLSLPERHRELVILKQLCGMSYEEVAREVGSDSIANVRRGVSRALSKLRAAIGDERSLDD